MVRHRRATWSVAITLVLAAACTPASALDPATATLPAPSPQPTLQPASATPQPSDTPTPAPTPAPTPMSPVVPGEAWIAYGALDGIRLVRPDGSDDHQLRAGMPKGQLHPDWSHDGERLAVAVDSTDGTRDLWLAAADGSSSELLFDCAAPCGWADDPAWSPDDRRIAFQTGVGVGDGGDGVGEIAVIDVATREVTTVYTAPAADYLYRPRWSPDASTMVVEALTFASARLDESEVVSGTIGTIALGTAAYEPLLPKGSGAGFPDWHPTDARIVFQMTSPDEGYDLHVIAADGTDLQQITTLAESNGRGIQPGWSPDGTQIVFLAESTPGTPDIGVIAADGGEVTIVPGGPYGGGPRLRPGAMPT
jgi:Tol biopolymer transport system component